MGSGIRAFAVSAVVVVGLVNAVRLPRATIVEARSAAVSTVRIFPTDTSLNVNDVNASAEPLLTTYTWPDNRVANAILMRFDLASLPAGAVVEEALLHLALVESDALSPAVYTITAHTITGKNPVIASATGYTADGATPWTANACCANGVPLAQGDISAAYDTRPVDKINGDKTWALTAMVREWVAEPSSNLGLLLNSDPSVPRDRYRFFASMEHANAALRPYLEITYSLPPGDTTPPSVAITAPASGAVTSGATRIDASASDAGGVAGVQFRVDGAPLGQEDTAAPYSVNWQTASVADGTHTLTATARDAAGNTAVSPPITVRTSNGSVLLSPEDTSLNLNSTNYSTDPLLTTYTWPDNRVANAIALKFNLAAIPAGAVVDSATLHLSLVESDTAPEATYTVTAHKIVGRNPVITAATGYNATTTTAWTANSCCSGGVPLAQADISLAYDTRTIDKTPGDKTWTITALVREWLADPATNFGVLLNSDRSALRDRYRFFASMEHADAGQRPYLHIRYSAAPPDPPPPPPPSGGIAAQYPGDVGIEGHPDVIFVERFDESSLATVFGRWTDIRNGSRMSLSTDVPPGSSGTRSLNIPWTGGVSDGGHLYKVLNPGIADVVYVRYYIKYPTRATYDHSGIWVGGNYPQSSWPNPQAGTKPAGNDRFIAAAEQATALSRFDHYNYWMNMHMSNDGMFWGNHLLNNPNVTARAGQWMCVEQMVKMNSPVTDSNGEHAIWLDGVKVSHLGKGFPKGTWSGGIFTQSANGAPFEGFRWRNDTRLNINWIWLQNYAPDEASGAGGNMHFDHVVVARKPIGCLAAGTPPPDPPPPPPPAGWPNEPAGLTLRTDWGMDQDIPASGDVPIPGSPNWKVVYEVSPGPSTGWAERASDAGAPRSPSNVYDFVYPQGMVEGHAPATVYYDGLSATEVYAGFWWKASSPFDLGPNGNKVAFIFNGGGGAGGQQTIILKPDGLLHVLPEYPGDFRWRTPNVNATVVTLGAWHRIEWYANKNGTLKWWLDGVLQGSYTDARNTFNFDMFQFSPTWGGNTGARKAQTDHYWFDHVRLSTR